MNRKICLVLFVMLTLASGCSSTTTQVDQALTQNSHTLDWQSNQFNVVVVPSKADIFYLTEKQKQHFLDYFQAEVNQSTDAHVRLYQYLKSILDGFHFRGETYSAAVALERQSGNCLSLAIVTTALANVVGLEVRYQKVNSAPVYQRFHNVMTLSSHVRTHVFAPQKEKKENEIVLIRPKIVIDYFPQTGNVGGDRVDYNAFLSMYYQNLAGDALVQKDFNYAYSLLSAAMNISDDNPETLNTLAVLFNKTNQTEMAETLFQYTLEHTKGSVIALENYAMMLERQGRMKELEALEVKLASVEDDNPYRWHDIANRQFAKQHYNIALKYFKRAIEVAPYLHEGHFGLAKTYFKIGLEKQAKVSMARAAELAFTPREEYLYQAKLRILRAKDIEPHYKHDKN